MPSLNFIDDLIAPSDRLKVRYDGPNPGAVLGMAPDMIKSIMKIPGKDLLETDIRWDISSEPNDFYGVWMGKRQEDRWTTTFLRVIIQGAHHSKEKTGWFTAEMKGQIETKYNYSNFLQRSFWWFFNYGFYYKQRRGYLENAKDDIMDMKDFLLTKFKIKQEE